MNPDQKADLEKVAFVSDAYLRAKYTKGAIRYGDLLDMDLKRLLHEALDENTDQRVYLLKALEKVDK